ncbi:MAG: hypothetical protein HQL51_10890 [Magnetococcales bacterium]|nr:hypothetical protein [Magnetococcales bacterium]
MATLAQAVEKLTELTGMNPSEVLRSGRALRDGGWIPKGEVGGGRGAVHLEPEHFARFLLALLGTDVSARAGEAVEKLSGWKSRLTGSGPDGQRALEVEETIRREWEGLSLGAGEWSPFSYGGGLETALSALIGTGGRLAGGEFLRRRVHEVEVDRRQGWAVIVFKEPPAAPSWGNDEGRRVIDALHQHPPLLLREVYLAGGEEALQLLLGGLRTPCRLQVTARVPGALLAELGTLARWRSGDGRSGRKFRE